jgi:hypothetical protein
MIHSLGAGFDRVPLYVVHCFHWILVRVLESATARVTQRARGSYLPVFPAVSTCFSRVTANAHATNLHTLAQNFHTPVSWDHTRNALSDGRFSFYDYYYYFFFFFVSE